MERDRKRDRKGMSQEERVRYMKRLGKSAEEGKTVKSLPEGAFQTVTLAVKDAFPEETLGISDASFWIEIEDEAGDFEGSRKEAVFQYYMRGYTHVELAETVLHGFQRFRSSVKTLEDEENMVSRLANVLYEDFPPRYRETHEKNAYS